MKTPPTYTFKPYRTFSENCVTNTPQKDEQYVEKDRREGFLNPDRDRNEISPLETIIAQDSSPDKLRETGVKASLSVHALDIDRSPFFWRNLPDAITIASMQRPPNVNDFEKRRELSTETKTRSLGLVSTIGNSRLHDRWMRPCAACTTEGPRSPRNSDGSAAEGVDKRRNQKFEAFSSSDE